MQISKHLQRTTYTIFKFANYLIRKFDCGQSRVRTYVLVREQIYSLSPLTARPSARNRGLQFGVWGLGLLPQTSNYRLQTYARAEDGTRTRDLLITNQLLYQLSYFGVHYCNQYRRKVKMVVFSPFARRPELQNTKNYPIFWDGKGNGKLNSAKF